jgi:uncharacterized cupin superfamily protein
MASDLRFAVTMPSKLDLTALTVITGSGYPSPFDEPCRKRENVRLGAAAALTQFGVVRTRLPPGAWTSQRHWHEHEDEFVYVLSGEVVLVTDSGEEVLCAGDCAGFKAGERNGHHLQNRAQADATLLVVGSRNDADWGEYPDIDMKFSPGRYTGPSVFRRKDGTPY